MIYLSNWSFFFVTLYFVCATIVSAIHYRKQLKHTEYDTGNRPQIDVKDLASRENSHNGHMPSFAIDTSNDVDDVAPDADDAEASEVFPMAWFHEALWVIYNIAAVAALLVTLTFWSLLFRLVNNLRALTVVVHGMNSVLMIGDTVLSSIPVRLFHVIYRWHKLFWHALHLPSNRLHRETSPLCCVANLSFLCWSAFMSKCVVWFLYATSLDTN